MPHWVVHWEPLGTLRGPWEGLQSLKTAKTYLKPSTNFCPPFIQAMLSFPIAKPFYGEIVYLDFSLHTMSSIGNHWGPSGVLGGPPEPVKGQTCLKSSDILLSTFFLPIVKSSQSKIFNLDFSKHIWLSVGSNWGPSVVLGGPSEPENSQKMLKIIIYSFVHLI